MGRVVISDMEEFLVKHAATISAWDYFGLIVAVSLLEGFIPKRKTGGDLPLRWFGNFTIDILGVVSTRLIFPVASFGFAVLCAQRGWGLLNQISLPMWLEFALTFIILDIATYAEHYLYHRVPVLWRIHRLHHTDQDVDFSTGVRHHPLETIISSGFTLTLIAGIGATPIAVLIGAWVFVVVFFTVHGNLRLSPSLDRGLRLFFVTPDMHRIHHSVDSHENNSNFGNLFPWWDRLFRTYVSSLNPDTKI